MDLNNVFLTGKTDTLNYLESFNNTILSGIPMGSTTSLHWYYVRVKHQFFPKYWAKNEVVPMVLDIENALLWFSVLCYPQKTVLLTLSNVELILCTSGELCPNLILQYCINCLPGWNETVRSRCSVLELPPSVKL